MNEIDEKIAQANKKLKLWTRFFIGMLIVLIIVGALTNVRVGFQILSESDTSEKYRKDAIKNAATADVYIDSAGYYSILVKKLRSDLDSAKRVGGIKDKNYKNLESKYIKLVDSLRSMHRYKPGSLEPVD